VNGTPGVSVVVCTRDRPTLLSGLLTALRSSTREQDEVVIVDSASRGTDVRRIVESSNFQYIRCDRPGVGRARNIGLAASSNQLVAFTDDDCLPAPDWMAAIAAAFATDRRIGLVTGRVVPDRHRRLPLSILVDENASLFDASGNIDTMGRGANMAFRRDALLEIGGFDEGLGPGARFVAAEDQDVFWRVLRAGWMGRYEPKVEVTHRQWRGEGRAFAQVFRYGIGRGALVSKMRRIDRAHGKSMLKTDLWSNGVGRAWTHMRAGYESGAASDLLRTLGFLIGYARAAFVHVEDGHFRT
jgi:GT2 family glycosyltransferase